MAMHPQAFGQMTTTDRLKIAKALGRKGGKKSAKRRKARLSQVKTTTKRIGKRRKTTTKRIGKRRKGGLLKKGSPAAKRRMAQLRKMRKK